MNNNDNRNDYNVDDIYDDSDQDMPFECLLSLILPHMRSLQLFNTYSCYHRIPSSCLLALSR